MLVLFKANTLVELEQREAELEDLSEEDLLDTKEGVQAKAVASRAPAAASPSRFAARKRRVTLQELEQLVLMATQLQISQSAQAPPQNHHWSPSHPRCPCDTRAGSPRKSHRSCGELEQF